MDHVYRASRFIKRKGDHAFSYLFRRLPFEIPVEKGQFQGNVRCSNMLK